MRRPGFDSDSYRSTHKTIWQTKAAALLLCLLMLILSAGCTSLNTLSKERSKALEEATGTLQESLTAAFTEAAEPADLLQAVIAFADDNEIYYKVVNDNTIILIKQATNETTDFPDVTMHCSISSADPEGSAAKAASILTALKESSNISRTTAILTLQDGLFYTGAMALPMDYLDTDFLLTVSGSESPVLFENSASLDTHKFTHSVTPVTIEGYKTYEITIDGLMRNTPAEIDEEQADPVLMLYEVLSWCEKSHIDYRLCSLDAGDAAATLPQSAAMTIAIDPTDINKFYNYMNGVVTAFKEEHGDGFEGPSYAFHMTDPQQRVISPADTTDLIGLIYTLLSNNEYLSKGDVDQAVGRQDISLISVNTTGISITISCRFVDASSAHDESSAFKELGRLNNFTVSDHEIFPRWTHDQDSLVSKTFERSAKDARFTYQTDDTCDILETGVFAMKKPDLEQLAIGISPDNSGDLTKALVLFIETDEPSSL